jgi:hypothetical protein
MLIYIAHCSLSFILNCVTLETRKDLIFIHFSHSRSLKTINTTKILIILLFHSLVVVTKVRGEFLAVIKNCFTNYLLFVTILTHSPYHLFLSLSLTSQLFCLSSGSKKRQKRRFLYITCNKLKFLM